MKKINYGFWILCALLCGAFASCIDDDNDAESYYDFAAYLTVPGDYAMTSRLLTDNGITLYATNPSVIAYKDGSYPERIYGYVKVLGEIFDRENVKETYTVKLIEDYISPVITSGFTQQPDTLKNFPVLKIFDVWAANGYLNIPFNMYMSRIAPLSSVNAYIDHSGNDTLYVKFSNGTTGTDNITNIISYRLNPDDIRKSGVTPNDGKIIINVTSAYAQDASESNCEYTF